MPLPNDVLALAMIEAAAAGDDDAVAAIKSMAHNDPDVFAQWKPGQSAAGESGWVSDGGQFRKEKPGGADEGEGGAATHKERHAADVDALAGKDATPEVKAAVSSRYMRCKEAVYGFMYHRFNPALQGVGELLKAVGDEPSDLTKMGYNPTSHQGGGGGVYDPVKANLGISTHLAATIATKALAKAFVWLKKKRSGDAAKMGDDWQPLADQLAALYDAANKAAGIDAPPHDPAAVLAAIRKFIADANPAAVEPVKKLADASPSTTPAAAHVGTPPGPPASSEVALPGKDGKALAALIRASKDAGAAELAALVKESLRTFDGRGALLSDAAVRKLAERMAAVNTTALLAGRSRVREMAERTKEVGNLTKFAASDVALSTFADGPGVLSSPEAAAAYFGSLVPTLSLDPERLATEQRRKAFTLAASANRALTDRVQKLILAGVRDNRSTADVTADITAAMEAAGVAHRNPQYSEMVFRTNAMDSFQTGMYEEGRHPDVAELFPVWQYLGIDDARAGEDHRPKFNRYYPAAAPFAAVRGNRPFNCRCSLRWVDSFDWDELRGGGARVEKW